MMSINNLPDSDLYTPEYFLQDDVCRLCWSKNADREISSKITENHRKIKNQLVEMIRYCVDVDVMLENYPRKVCISCFSNIEKFSEFKKFCIETDRKLHEILSKGTLEANIEPLSPCGVKIEKFEDFSNVDLSKTDSLDSFLDNLTEDTYETERVAKNDGFETQCVEKKTCKVKKKYQPKRSPTYCNICRIDFSNKDKFTLHNSKSHGVEHNGERFKCFGCEKRFKNRKTRLGHEINFCKGLKDGYKCPLCDRFLPKRGMYEAHMRDHRGNTDTELPEDIFKCIKCYKLFKTKESLSKHMAEHKTEKKNYVCESCGRVFTRQDYLHKHTLTHSGLKLHVCPHCGFRATQRSSLTVHIRKHTGERPYECDVCPQRCVSSSNLRAHRRRHQGLKNYQCTICSKKFGYKLSLEEHVSSTHERAQAHACTLCGAAYTRARGLRRHITAKHGKGAKEPKTDPKSDQTHLADPKSNQTHLADPKSDQTHLADPKNNQTHLADPKSDQTHLADPKIDQADFYVKIVTEGEEKVDLLLRADQVFVI